MAEGDFVDPRTKQFLEEELRKEYEDMADFGQNEAWVGYQEEPVKAMNWRGSRNVDAVARRAGFIEQILAGKSIAEACDEVGVSRSAYNSWRTRYPGFKDKVDEAKLRSSMESEGHVWNGTPAHFHARYFGRQLTWFQLMCIREFETMPRGHILLVLWPPDHGKTSTFEDHATRKLALDPQWRFLVASESRPVAQKMLGAIMNRMDPMGPTPELVTDFGPFMPQSGRSTQPWSDIRFRVWNARFSDQRDYSMQALGVTSKGMLSARSDHAHGDDIQSVETLGQTDKIEERVRQDFWSRAGAHGIKSLFGSRVGDDDVWERLLLDDELMASKFVKVIKLRAITTDMVTGKQEALWPERYNLDQLEMIRVTQGPESFDRNYMMAPGFSSKGHRTFTREMVDACKDPNLSLAHHPPAGAICYIGLDPAIEGRNCVLGVEVTVDNKLIVRRIQETLECFNNSQVIGQVEQVLWFMEGNGGHVTDVVIESKAFQKGLLHDESLKDLRARNHFSVQGHDTGWNKYDDDIGVPSLAESFIRGEIVLPWAEDDMTRGIIAELCSQLYKWKQGLRGNRHRQDMVMALWFAWILWRSRWKAPVKARKKSNQFRRSGLPWSPTESGLLVPQGGGMRA